MRGDMELHPRHFAYFFSGVFSGSTVKYFINKVVFSCNTFYTNPENISVVVCYVLMALGVFTGIYIDDYLMRYKYQINYRKFLLFEVITIILFNLIIAMLLVFTLLYKL